MTTTEGQESKTWDTIQPILDIAVNMPMDVVGILEESLIKMIEDLEKGGHAAAAAKGCEICRCVDSIASLRFPGEWDQVSPAQKNDNIYWPDLDVGKL